jgi:hypothetical protein
MLLDKKEELLEESLKKINSLSEVTSDSGAVTEFSEELSHIIESALKRQSATPVLHRNASRTPTRNSATGQSKSPRRLNVPFSEGPDLELQQLTFKVPFSNTLNQLACR